MNEAKKLFAVRYTLAYAGTKETAFIGGAFEDDQVYLFEGIDRAGAYVDFLRENRNFHIEMHGYQICNEIAASWQRENHASDRKMMRYRDELKKGEIVEYEIVPIEESEIDLFMERYANQLQASASRSYTWALLNALNASQRNFKFAAISCAIMAVTLIFIGLGLR